MQVLILAICGFFLMSCSWFCLWALSLYFINDPILAMLFFPFALRLGVVLHTPRRYWLLLYSVEWLLIIAIGDNLQQEHWSSILLLSASSLPFTFFASKLYHGSQWQKLSVIAGLILVVATVNVILLSGLSIPLMHYWLASVTGSLMLVPSCYLLWSYLFERVWIPLNPDFINKPVALRGRHIAWYVLVFVLNIFVQIVLPDELQRFAPFCLAIPIILLAFRYGWQGALLGTLLNSVALIALSGELHTSIQLTDLLLSLMAQTMTGICLGLAVQHQRDLNTSLRKQLKQNHMLSRQLVKTEENIRKGVARELHDEIGQNITAIKTQANIIKRVEEGNIAYTCASLIESLSLNIYDTTKGLLTQLRPKTLDDLGLKESVLQLVRDMELTRLGIDVKVEWLNEDELFNAQGNDKKVNINQKLKDRPVECFSEATQVTIYRIFQEALNNIVKYANASMVELSLTCENNIVTISVKDNGVGLVSPKIPDQGLGLKGMQERVEALGGKFRLSTKSHLDSRREHGTQVYVQLPLL